MNHFVIRISVRLFQTIIFLVRSLSRPHKELHIYVCHWCKKVLSNPSTARHITKVCCAKCYFKKGIGELPRFPKFSDFAIVRALFKSEKPDYDWLWTGQMIYRGLKENGRIEKKARNEMRSLDAEERNIIMTVRNVAEEHGYSKLFINDTEMQGYGYFPQ